MSLINVSIEKNQDGFPTHATLNRNGRTLNVTYNPDGLISFQGRMHEDFKPILQMIWPFEKDLRIQEPLLTKTAAESEIILKDDMEGLLKWTETGATVAADNTNAYNGSQCLQLTGAAGAAANATRYFPLNSLGKLKIEAYFNFDVRANIESLTFQIDTYTGGNHATFGIRLNGGVVWQYLPLVGGYVNFYTSQGYELLLGVGGSWNKVSFTIDLANFRYLDFQCNNSKMDLSAECYHEFALDPQLSTIDIFADANPATNLNVRIDDLLIKEVT